MRRAVLVAAMTVAGSCARASAPVAAEATTVAAPPRAFLDRQEVDAIIEAVSGARSLPVGRPIRIEVVSRPELEARVREEAGRGAELAGRPADEPSSIPDA